MKKEIPALTKSGGMLSEFGGKKAVLEYRVWYHYHEADLDDEYIVDSNLRNLQKRRKELLKDKQIVIVEQPLAVVWDKKQKDYREVKIDGINYEQKEVKE